MQIGVYAICILSTVFIAQRRCSWVCLLSALLLGYLNCSRTQNGRKHTQNCFHVSWNFLLHVLCIECFDLGLGRYMTSKEVDLKAVERLPLGKELAVVVENDTFFRDEKDFETTLWNINLQIKRESLVEIVSIAGYGNSLLLSSILGAEHAHLLGSSQDDIDRRQSIQFFRHFYRKTL